MRQPGADRFGRLVDEELRHRHGARLVCLRGAEDNAAGDFDNCPSDGRASAFEVQVVDAKSRHLAVAHSGRG